MGILMSIGNWKVEFPDQSNDGQGAQTRLCRMACSNVLADVIASGFLNALVNPASSTQSGSLTQGYVPLPNDLWFICYSGGSGMFNVSITNSGIVTLSQASGNSVSLLITAAQFNGM